MSNNSLYKCVSCDSNDLHSDHTVFLCKNCGSRYPLIDHIPIFVPNPEAALSAYAVDLDGTKQRLRDINNIAEGALTKKKSPSEIRRIEQILSGTTSNIRFLDQQFSEILNCLRDKDIEGHLLSWASVQTGLSFHDMLIYFYQDWFGNKEFQKVTSFFCEAVENYSPDRHSLAVLGAGACGLVYGMSRYFHNSYGVDLGLPALLAAKRLISGDPLTFHLEQANWKQISLTPPPLSPNNIHFTTANVMNLPFKDNSLSTVATQCVLDVLGDPLYFAEEVHRVLRVRGIWINFSHPTNTNEDQSELGSRSLDEFVDLAEDSGFKARSTKKMRFKFLNLEAIDPSAAVTDSEVWCFVLENTGPPNRDFNCTRKRELFRSKPEALWPEVPRIVGRRQPTLSYGKTFSSHGTSEQSTLSVMGYSLDIPLEYARYLESLLTHVDGKATFSDIYEKLCSEGGSLSELDFLRLMQCLSVDHYLIDFSYGQNGS